VNRVDPSGQCWSLAPGIEGPCLTPPEGVPYDGSFDTNEIAQYPQVLEGMNPSEVLESLGGVPSGFSVRPGSSGSAGLGAGWVLENPKDGGTYIRWSPGTARAGDGVHPEGPYWRVTSGRNPGSGDERYPGGSWDDGPEPYVKNSDPEGDGSGQEDGGGDPCLASTSSQPNGPVLDACGELGSGLGGSGDDDQTPGAPTVAPEFELGFAAGNCRRNGFGIEII